MQRVARARTAISQKLRATNKLGAKPTGGAESEIASGMLGPSRESKKSLLMPVLRMRALGGGCCAGQLVQPLGQPPILSSKLVFRVIPSWAKLIGGKGPGEGQGGAKTGVGSNAG